MKKYKEFEKIFKNRISFIFYFSLLVVLIIVYKLISIHLINREFYMKKAQNQTVGKVEINSFRGRILDRNNLVLAYSIPYYSIAIRPTLTNDKELDYIFNILKKLNIKPYFTKDEILKLKEERVPFVWLSRKTIEAYNYDEIFNNFFSNISSIEIIREPSGKRIYNFKDLTDIIGVVDIDERGLEGLELYLDKNSKIRGQDGYYILQFDGQGNPIYTKVIDYKKPIDGQDVILSIDARLQSALSNLAYQKLIEHNAKEVSIVVANIYGEILACVSKEKEHVNYQVNAIAKMYEPGSIFKIFTIVSALDNGVSPDEKFFSGPSIIIDGWTISNADDGLYTSGFENLEDILTYSFNVGTVSVMKRIGTKKFIEYLNKLGFYELSGVEHPSDVKPLIGDLNNEPLVRFATISFGQGIAISPLHITKLMTIIANGGYKVNLTFIKDKNKDYKKNPKVLSDYAIKEIRKYLRSVVVRGTGKKAEVEGYFCAGKTGTAQMISDKGGYEPGKYAASFVGFFPYFDPQYIIFVVVKEPVGMYYGGQVAAPIFNKAVLIITSMYNLKPYFNN
ncbi:MAG: peptidoglycan D,D-transpeptidase FtsI family protein [bacterium]|jgi:cell division protein FtsI/penicillin-binding protein 2